MKRIDTRTVELTEAEDRAQEFFERCLDRGQGIYEGVYSTLREHPGLATDFYVWLGEP
jgi:hypothetical protein